MEDRRWRESDEKGEREGKEVRRRVREIERKEIGKGDEKVEIKRRRRRGRERNGKGISLRKKD